jgi:hypothetical protein
VVPRPLSQVLAATDVVTSSLLFAQGAVHMAVAYVRLRTVTSETGPLQQYRVENLQHHHRLQVPAVRQQVVEMRKEGWPVHSPRR